MCLPDFQEFKQISKLRPMTGHRNWNNPVKTLDLKAQNFDYIWSSPIDGPNEVTDKDSGLYAYNHNNYYNNNYYNYNNYNDYNNDYNDYNNYNYNNYYNHYNHYNYNNYSLGGIIKQWGKVAIHKTGQRSEYAKIAILFTIREIDAEGDKKFINWIKEFNLHVKTIAKKYKAKTMHWQDFIELQKSKTNTE